MTPLQQFYRWLSEQQAPRVLEIGTRGWDGKPPRHQRDDVLRANPKAVWVGCDVEAGPGVDVVADAHTLSKTFKPHEFDAWVMCSTLEHLARPWIVAQELAKVTRRGGLGFAQTHQTFPLHPYPRDYFRFSKEALGEVFSEDAGWRVVATEYQFPARVVPTSNYVRAIDWNFEAEAWLNIEVLVERV